MVRLAVVLKSFERTHDFYKSKIISDDVFYDTIKDAAVWCENNQNNGLKTTVGFIITHRASYLK